MYSERLEKKLTERLEEKYNLECYSGATSYLFNLSHKLMEKKLSKNHYDKVLEIGAGIHPHIKYIKHNFNSYYCCENSKYTISYLNKNFPKIETIYSENIEIPNNMKFDRIIMSHSLEHIYKPESVLQKIYELLNDDGVISIAIPTDPAIAYRFLRYFKKKIFSGYKISEKEYDYINAIEHINSFNNNHAIIKYLFKDYKQYYFPFNFLSSDFNIFSFYQIFKNKS